MKWLFNARLWLHKIISLHQLFLHIITVHLNTFLLRRILFNSDINWPSVAQVRRWDSEDWPARRAQQAERAAGLVRAAGQPGQPDGARHSRPRGDGQEEFGERGACTRTRDHHLRQDSQAFSRPSYKVIGECCESEMIHFGSGYYDWVPDTDPTHVIEAYL